MKSKFRRRKIKEKFEINKNIDRKPVLETAEQKLFFILYYCKSLSNIGGMRACLVNS
ncbi:MAG: hypothetical protein Q9M97_01560 [Candidatus Gracilibacteria bacterium]|nr:hypothetical protein [Candidatus Gracilibacteria bacterium]